MADLPSEYFATNHSLKRSQFTNTPNEIVKMRIKTMKFVFVHLILAQNDDRKKRPRTAFSASQIKALETEFERGKYLSVAKRTALAKQLRLTETQVKSPVQMFNCF